MVIGMGRNIVNNDDNRLFTGDTIHRTADGIPPQGNSTGFINHDVSHDGSRHIPPSSTRATSDHSSYHTDKGLDRQNADDVKRHAQAQVHDLRSEGSARWPSDEGVALARVRKLALGLQRTLTILALITGTLTGIILASSGLPRHFTSLTATFSPSRPRPSPARALTRTDVSRPDCNDRSSTDDANDSEQRRLGEGAGERDDADISKEVPDQRLQSQSQAGDVRNQGSAGEKHQEGDDLEPEAREILRMGDEASDREKSRSDDDGDDAEEASVERSDRSGSGDDAAVVRRAGEIYKSWTRIFFPELVQELKGAKRKGRNLRQGSDSTTRVANRQIRVQVGVQGHEQDPGFASTGAEAVLEGESKWDIVSDPQADKATLGGIEPNRAADGSGERIGQKAPGLTKAEAAGEERGEGTGTKGGRGIGERRRGGKSVAKGKAAHLGAAANNQGGEGIRKNGGGRKSVARGKAAEAHLAAGAPRPFHLQNCSLLQTMYREEMWIDRPPSGEVPPWALIEDNREGASQNAQDYILPPGERQKMQRHWASRAVNKTVSEAFWWPSQTSPKARKEESSKTALDSSQLYYTEEVSSEAQKEGDLGDPLTEGPFPPWVEGGDRDNYPLTRRVQRDIWVHQHPLNCSDPSVKFWYSGVGPREKHGFGAQMNMAAGALALAVAEGRVLVLRRFNRAAHQGCPGRTFNRLSCYFAPETSEACRQRVEQLMRDPRSTRGRDPPLKLWAAAHPLDYFFPPVPPLWGQPWLRIPPVVEAKGRLIKTNRMQNKYRWWRAQAFKYLMRAPTEYTCHVVNRERHLAFGRLAALEAARGERALRDLGGYLSQEANMGPGATERELWARASRPWVPRSLVAVHVRMGDKAREMAIAGAEEYLELLGRVRLYDPSASHVWLSTEMQLVIDVALEQRGWNWHCSRVQRIQGNNNKMKMPLYEESLGVKESVENALANLFISLQADYFIGALGSAWSYLIDGLRCTSGKMRNGFLSTNLSPRW